MSERDTQVAALVRQLEVAFGRLKHPGPDNISDASLSTPEAGAMATDFAGAHWMDLDPQHVRKHWSGLIYLTPEAYRFYLPAYIRAALTFPDRIGRGDIQEGTILSLGPIELKEPGAGERLFRERISLLTDEQKRTVATFLALMRQDHLPNVPALKPDSEWNHLMKQS